MFLHFAGSATVFFLSIFIQLHWIFLGIQAIGKKNDNFLWEKRWRVKKTNSVPMKLDIFFKDKVIRY